jgi:hypothetical protein
MKIFFRHHRRKLQVDVVNSALRNAGAAAGDGSRNAQPIASHNAIIGYQLYRSECTEEETRRSSSICYLYTDADQMRVESNIVHF